MPLNNEHIDIELLRRYYANELSQFQRNQLEQQALDDPFIKAAMDGFDSTPGSFEAFYARHKSKLNSSNGSTFLIGAVVLTLLFGFTLIIKQFTPNEVESTANHVSEIDTTDSKSIAENDLKEDLYIPLPQELETLQVVDRSERISYEEIVCNKEKIENQLKTETTETEKIDSIKDEPIVINDPITLEHDFELEEESILKKNGKPIPSTYLFSLYTVDYSKIRSSDENIRSSRFELSGTSADRESESIPTMHEMTEIQVDIPYSIYLRKSMQSFSKNKYKYALKRYLTILEQYPEDLNALFYGGLSYFNLGNYNKANSFFLSIENINLNAFKEESRWYRAKSLIKLNQKHEALELLDQIIVNGGFYTTDAIRLKKELK